MHASSIAPRGLAALALIAALAATSTPPAAAQPARASLTYDWKVDGAITIAGAVLWIASDTVFKPTLAPSACRWCDDGGANAVDDAVRDALRWDDLDAAHQASSIAAYALVPAVALGGLALGARGDGHVAQWPADALVVLEATVVAVDLNQAVKLAVARRRPLIHDGRAYPADDANLSFYSGHTNLVFALATAAGTVASIRGYRAAPWIWGGGLALAATTGYLRIAADRHYLTDVVTGAVVGSAIGIGVPYVFHRRCGAGTITSSASTTGVAVGWQGRW